MPAPTRPSRSEAVFQRLREEIVSGSLAIGSRHSIYGVAERLGVSRTPVREAVLRLADLGLVAIERNRGFVVRGIAAEDIRAVFELRLLVEAPGAAVAATAGDAGLLRELEARIAGMQAALDAEDEAAFIAEDRALHAAILGGLGNPRATALVEALRDATQSVGALTFNRSRRLAEIADEHRPIVQAIAAGDADAARAAMAAHLASTVRALLAQFDPGGPPPEWLDRILAVVGPVQ